MSQFRNANIGQFVEELEGCFDAIINNSFGKLGVAKVLADNRQERPEMSIDEARIIAIQNTARKAMLMTKALATGTDRMSIMVGQMSEAMQEQNNEASRLYRNRLNVLTDFNSIVKQLDSGIVKPISYEKNGINVFPE